MGPYGTPEPDPRLAAELDRLDRRMDAEVRAEHAEYEALAALGALRDRGLRQVAVELVHRGDTVSVRLPPGHAWTGTMCYAAGDLATLDVPTGRVDLNLAAPLAIRVDVRVTRGGHAVGAGPSGFRARLHEHASRGDVLQVALLTEPAPLRVRLVAVARDHVVLDGRRGREFVALPAVGAVAQAPDRPDRS